MTYNVISVDNHILEPYDRFVTRVPKQFRDRAPRMARGADGASSMNRQFERFRCMGSQTV